jgi:hypothetical protein
VTQVTDLVGARLASIAEGIQSSSGNDGNLVKVWAATDIPPTRDPRLCVPQVDPDISIIMPRSLSAQPARQLIGIPRLPTQYVPGVSSCDFREVVE